MALLAWGDAGVLYRPTMDIDLLGRTANSEQNLVGIFQAVARQAVEDDGLQFEPESVAVEPITDADEYQGMRIKLLGRLANARIPMQIDIGFSDVPLPPPEPVQLLSILNFPAPTMNGYRPESTIAEKFQTMVARNLPNSRMKDFADLWFLSNHLSFDGAILANAIAETFRRRGTAMPAEPVALSELFGQDSTKRAQWSAFLRKGQLHGLPEDISQMIAAIATFLLPICQAIASGASFTGTWNPAGPWQTATF